MEKDTNPTEQAKKDIQVYEAVSAFIKDKQGVYIYRRSEKICKAYFLLTQHIQDNESVKAKLRESALDLTSKTLDLVGALNKSEDLSRSIVLEALSLVSMSDMASTSRLISESNYLLVVKQIEIFIAEVENYWKAMSHNSQAIPSTLFNIDMSDAEPLPEPIPHSHGMSFIKDTLATSVVKQNLAISKSSRESKKNDYLKTSSQSSSVSVDSSSKSTEGHKNERQTLIMETIKIKGELSIKDLTEVIKGCSEKTIQRELIALVGVGALLKTGERRWSRYSLSK